MPWRWSISCCHSPRLQIADDFLDDLALEVVRLHRDRLGPADLLVQPGKTQTAFLALNGALAVEDDRIEQHFLLVALLGIAGRVEDEDAIRQKHLVGGQAETAMLVHQFQHMARIEVDLFVDSGQRPRRMTQRGMRVQDNLHATLIGDVTNLPAMSGLYRSA